MADFSWQNAFVSASPYVVKISTPECTGTGFLLNRSASSTICSIATAAHVIDRADEWGQPIRLRHQESGTNILLQPGERAITYDHATDTAVIVFDLGTSEGALPLPTQELVLADEDKTLRIGNEVCWLGFPAVAPEHLCFFSGRVSCYIKAEGSYLIDGVAINGVSGGPCFFVFKETLRLIGVISAYLPNWSTGQTLPGVAVVKDLTRLHEWVRKFRTLNEAQKAEPLPDGN